MSAVASLASRTAIAPLLAAAAASCLGGSAIVATRMIAGEMDTTLLAFLRYGLAAGVIVPAAIVLSGGISIRKGDLVAVACLGGLYFGAFPALFTEALRLTTAAQGALIIALVPILALVIGAAAGRDRVSIAKVFGIALAVAGLALALGMLTPAGSINAHRSDLEGDGCMFAAALCSATFGVFSRGPVVRNGPIQVMAAGMIVGVSLLALLCLAGHDLRGIDLIDARSWGWILYLALPGCAAAFALLVWAYSRTDPSRVAAFLILNPFVAMLLAVPVLGERPSISLIGGLIASCVGIAVATGSGAAIVIPDDGPKKHRRASR